MTIRVRPPAGMAMLYDVRYLEAGSPRRVRVEAIGAAAAVAAAAAAVEGGMDPRAAQFELLSVVPSAVRIGGEG